MDKEIKFYGNIEAGGISAVDFSNTISEMEQKGTKNLTIHMHSYGGSVFDGNLIYNAIKQSKIKTKIVIDGIAASMASIILLAANEVEIAENGYVMVHRPQANNGGDYETLLQNAKLLKDMETDFARCWAKRTGKKESEFITNWLDGKDHWLNADEAVNYGFATRKITAIAKVENLKKDLFPSIGIKNLYDKYAASLNLKENTMKKQLIDLLKLENVTENSSDDEVLQKVKEKFEQLENQLKEKQTETDANVNALVQAAVKQGKITASMTETYTMIGKTNGLKVLSNIIENLQRPVTITGMLQNYNANIEKSNKENWTLEDYRKFDPKALEKNPKLFDELFKKQYNNNNQI